MTHETFVSRKFQAKTLARIEQVNSIIAEYQQRGFTLTVRQLFYQLVARQLVENTQSAYKRVGEIVNDARLAGVVDWDAIEDRTRYLPFVERSLRYHQERRRELSRGRLG